jgi:undecaprenyl-diphosphatase
VLELRDLSDLVHAVDPLMLAAGWVSAFVVGMASILLLLRLVRGGKLYLFSIYLVPLGIAGLLFL